MNVPENIQQSLFLKISRKTGQTLHEYNLLEANDRVLIGLSGGKDSYVLLETLADQQKRVPFKFELFAVHVIVTDAGYLTDTRYMLQLCDSLNVPLYIIEDEVKLNENSKKAPCFVCSWTRRKRIFNLSNELKCNKVAFGHHKDDALATFLMNLVYHGSISAMPQKLSMFEGRVQLIRPLLMLNEDLIIQYAQIRGFVKEKKKCPYDKETKRSEAKNLLQQLAALHPNAKTNLFKAMNNVFPEYLPTFNKKHK